MKKFIIENLFWMYLGSSLFIFTNLFITNWQFWAIVLPLVFIDTMLKIYKDEKLL